MKELASTSPPDRNDEQRSWAESTPLIAPAERPPPRSHNRTAVSRSLRTPTHTKESEMTITTTTLFRVAGVAAILAGLIFIGVQINHPYLNATSITTTDVMARNSLKMLMAALALAGITGVYLRQVPRAA